ncbi:delta-aminolevulinic acid dehydratase [Thecamonas trahens ATCC 50062]|uniref:Delta-aminolevulinic acid dehydratase n=1 Tax=Thecamonas trahens ATCC 50062 TaxID=461836 RepID=A0A0L0D2X4_THETB|nr:delta-aminolevulinic acid dehydratase [Thecamonas trahens ATCC 50062]KNC46546.1 delta-aminolevulinic acid dehydratase [Thecamonas trahens ATCC 50062]|eukprot:XP_013760325.1 delta-aminolevulinic acid dehydratase [Thecamonas trahens ATCC 50062]
MSSSKSSSMPAPHRLRTGLHHPVLRTWQSEAEVTLADIVYPIFLTAPRDAKEEIAAMPGQFRLGVDVVVDHLAPLVAGGLRALLLFGVLPDDACAKKDGTASYADAADNPVMEALPLLRNAFPDVLLITDVCMCPYTDHGHCGIIENEYVCNDASVARLAEIGVSYARAGAHVLAPSDMMDGRIGALKDACIAAGLEQVSVMSYSAKFASAFYGPFRSAAKSAPSFGDRRTHQLPPGAKRIANRALVRDIREGADILMVKPAMPYMDLIQDAAAQSSLPVACYQVSGEFAMIYHAAAAGALDLKAGVLESLTCLKRAGATILITYFAPQLVEWLGSSE